MHDVVDVHTGLEQLPEQRQLSPSHWLPAERACGPDVSRCLQPLSHTDTVKAVATGKHLFFTVTIGNGLPADGTLSFGPTRQNLLIHNMSGALEDGETTADDRQTTATDALTTFTDAVEIATKAEVERLLDSVRTASETREEKAKEISGLLDELVEEVAAGYEQKVRDASAEGKTCAELYYFDGAAKYKETDYSLLFLTKGPKSQQQNYFIRLGVLPFLGKLYARVYPFDVDMQYLPESNENIVSISWRPRK